jgi:hypothetical protein
MAGFEVIIYNRFWVIAEVITSSFPAPIRLELACSTTWVFV